MDAEEYLTEAGKKGKIHHTILVEGGDEKIVLFFVKLLFPEHQYKKSLDSYFEVVKIKPEGTSIKISQIREMEELTALKPFSSKWRIVVIEEADKLTNEAANALLKILEEPPESTYFLLLTDIPSSLPMTILSRSLHLLWRGKESRRKGKLGDPSSITKRDELKEYIENLIYFLRDWIAAKEGEETLYFERDELGKASPDEKNLGQLFDSLVRIYSLSDRANISISKAYIKSLLEDMKIGKL